MLSRVVTRLTDGQTDRHTDGRTEFSSQDRICLPCSAVKMGVIRELHANRYLVQYGFALSFVNCREHLTMANF